VDKKEGIRIFIGNWRRRKCKVVYRVGRRLLNFEGM
jgi:hypothetical protein